MRTQRQQTSAALDNVFLADIVWIGDHLALRSPESLKNTPSICSILPLVGSTKPGTNPNISNPGTRHCVSSNSLSGLAVPDRVVREISPFEVQWSSLQTGWPRRPEPWPHIPVRPACKRSCRSMAGITEPMRLSSVTHRRLVPNPHRQIAGAPGNVHWQALEAVRSCREFPATLHFNFRDSARPRPTRGCDRSNSGIADEHCAVS